MVKDILATVLSVHTIVQVNIFGMVKPAYHQMSPMMMKV